MPTPNEFIPSIDAAVRRRAGLGDGLHLVQVQCPALRKNDSARDCRT